VAETIEIRVPNIGDFQGVPVIDVLVKPGDTVALDDTLITLESDKSTLDVPASQAGVVAAVVVNVGDKVSEGTPILMLRARDAAADIRDAATVAEPALVLAEQAATSLAGGSAPVDAALAPGERTEIEIRVPDIGDFHDVPVIDVLVAPGDRVDVEAPLIVLESDKSAMEIPSPSSGVFVSIALRPGDKVSMGTLIGTLTTSAPAVLSDAASVVSASAGQASTGPATGSAGEPTESAGAAPAIGATHSAATPPLRAGGNATTGPVHASPSIRRFARELGVDLAAVNGSGPTGRVTREDVNEFVKHALRNGAPRAGGGPTPFDLPLWPKIDFAQFGAIEIEPLSRIKRISGPLLHRNWIGIPHVTNNEDADITELEAFRKKANADRPDAKLTILAFLLKAVVSALQRHPEVNSSLDGDNLVLKRYYHLGFAADTPNGLLVPVLRDVDRKGVLELARETRELAAKARDGKLTTAEMSGASFTISSLGGIGGTSFTPIVNAPEVAILGVSRAAIRPVWDGAAFVPRLILPLSLSYDHRVIDGALAARFNATLATLLADLRGALL
jgi:pyruvate dehydrogenase E2 component (dihydrolipoamide acetyltransferase)